MMFQRIAHGTGRITVSLSRGSGKVSCYRVQVGNLATMYPDLTRTFHDQRGHKRAIVRANIHAERLRHKGYDAKVVPVRTAA